MSNLLEGRVAIVTGAGRGIGRAIAAKLSSAGADLVLVDLEAPEETASIIGGSPLTFTADVAKFDDWQSLARQVEDRFGRADIVVNNAGIIPTALIDDVDLAVWHKTMAVNLDAHFFSAKVFVPIMRRQKWGRFINISSNSIGSSVPGLSHYIASKMGVIGFVRGLANDVAADGITVNALLPAITNTHATADIPEEAKMASWQSQAIKRFAEPEDIAMPVVFLSSEDSAFITGQAIVVDGGQYKIS